jgi:hypothetical protein
MGMQKRVAISCASVILLFAWCGFLIPAKAQADNGCKTLNAPIFDLSGHFVPGGRITSCPTSTVDTTEAPNALQRGDVLSFSRGRYMQRQLFLLRGTPNTPYLFPVRYAADIAAAYIADPAYYDLSSLALALPFQPRQIATFDDIGDGATWYGYTGLQIMTSHARDALPLNEKSVVVAVDGYSFRTPNAFLSLLSKPDNLGQRRRYVEVVYFQRDDPNAVLKRALIPLSIRGDLEPEWSNSAAQNTAFGNSRYRLQQAVMALALAGLVKTFTESDTGKAWLRDQTACLRDSHSLSRSLGC